MNSMNCKNGRQSNLGPVEFAAGWGRDSHRLIGVSIMYGRLRRVADATESLTMDNSTKKQSPRATGTQRQ
jgi:hypothetical protein